MPDVRVSAVLDELVPRDQRETRGMDDGWQDVRRRAARLRRRRRRALAAVTAAGAALFGALAAGGQIGALIPHSKAPHVLVRGTIHGPGGRSVGTVEVELERTVLVIDRSRVRLLRWRYPSARGLRARWFLELDPSVQPGLRHGSLVVRSGRPHAGDAIVRLCGPCRTSDSGELELSTAQASVLLNDGAAASMVTQRRARLEGALALDRTSLRRAVACVGPGLDCRRIYTGRP